MIAGDSNPDLPNTRSREFGQNPIYEIRCSNSNQQSFHLQGEPSGAHGPINVSHASQ